MPNPQSTREEQVRLFWDHYIQKAHESGVKEPFDRWMVKRAEAYLAAHPDRKLAEQTPADVESYLANLGRKADLKGWQFRQAVDAIQMLFRLAEVDWLDQVDWDHWRDSARTLPNNHPTLARDYEPLPGRRATQTRDPDQEAATFAAIREAHGPLLEQAAVAARVRGLAIRTEQTYLHWIMRYIGYLGNRDPTGLGAEDAAAFLEHLAIDRKVSASTQNLALNSLVFLYREVLKREDLDLGEFARAKRPRRLPTVLTHAEVAALLSRLTGTPRLMVSLMYGTGMRLMECVRLRVQDIDFGFGQIAVRNAKGGKDRVVPLPERAAAELRRHLTRVRELHQGDLKEGLGEVYLPDALARKIPSAAKDWRWQYVFPSGRISRDPRSGPCAAITCMRPPCRRRSTRRPGRPGSPNGSGPIP